MNSQSPSNSMQWSANECRLGPRTVVVLATLFILQLGLGPRAGDPLESLTTQIWLGAMWAGWAVSVWILVRQPLRPTRVIALGLLLGWHCLLMAIVRTNAPERYFIMLGSYGILQALITTMLQLPTWRLWYEAPSEARKLPQFNILGIMAVTTMVAVLLTAMQRYAPQAAENFMTGTAFFNLLMVTLAAVAMTGSRLKLLSVAMFPALTAVAIAIAWIAAWGEGEPSAVRFEKYWIAYGTIITTFAWLVWSAGVSGRFDAIAMPKDPAAGKSTE